MTGIQKMNAMKGNHRAMRKHLKTIFPGAMKTQSANGIHMTHKRTYVTSRVEEAT